MALLKPAVLAGALLLSSFAPGWALLQLFPQTTGPGKTGLVERFVISTILSLSIFEVPQILLSWVLQLPIVSLWNKLYLILVLISSGFLTLQLLRSSSRASGRAIWWNLSVRAKLSLFSISGALITYLIILVIDPPYLDYNAVHYYLYDALVYVKTALMPVFVPPPLAPPATFPMTMAPFIPLCFTYALTIENLLFHTATLEVLPLFSIIFITDMVAVSALLFRAVRIPRAVAYTATLIFLSFPLVYLYMFFTPMGTDLAFGSFSLSAVYFAIKVFTHQKKLGSAVLTALSCGLAAVTKIEYPLTFLFIGLVAVFYIVRRPAFRFAIAGLGVLGEVAVFCLLTPDLFALVGSPPFFLAVSAFALLFTLLYGRDVTPPSSIKWASGVKLFAVFGILTTLSVVYLYRGYILTGSLMSWYRGQALDVKTPNYKWAASIDQVRYLDEPWRAGMGERPGLPEKNYLVPVLGYEWNPVLLPFLLVGLFTLLFTPASAEARLLGSLLLITFLTWWLVFGQDHTRQLLVISPLIALMQALGIATLWKAIKQSFLAQWGYTIFLLLLGAPFSVAVFSYYHIIFEAPFSLTSWHGVGYFGYYSSQNLIEVLKFVGATTCIALVLIPFRREVAKLLRGRLLFNLRYALIVSLMLVLWLMQASPLFIVLRDYGTISTYQQSVTDEMIGGFIPAVRYVEKLYPNLSSPGTIVIIRAHDVEVITDYRFKRYDIMQRVANGYYKDLLTSTSMTDDLGSMEKEQMVAAILPEPTSRYYHSFILTKYSPNNLPFYWLIGDSGIFPSIRLGEWTVLDLGRGPLAFNGFVTILIETETGRGRIFGRDEFVMDTSDLGNKLKIIPVVDASGYARQTGRGPNSFHVETKLTYRIFLGKNTFPNACVKEAQASIWTTGTFGMPTFDLNELADQVIEETGYPGALTLQVVRITCDVQVDGESPLGFKAESDGESPIFYYDSISQKWQFDPHSGTLHASLLP